MFSRPRTTDTAKKLLRSHWAVSAISVKTPHSAFEVGRERAGDLFLPISRTLDPVNRQDALADCGLGGHGAGRRYCDYIYDKCQSSNRRPTDRRKLRYSVLLDARRLDTQSGLESQVKSNLDCAYGNAITTFTRTRNRLSKRAAR
jgi:hypothetical protein